MRGTEKQIAWASELKETVVKVLNDSIEMQRAVAPQLIENIKGFEALRDVVESYDGYAGDVIGMFKDYSRKGDVMKDMMSLLNTIKASRITPYESGDLGKQLRNILFCK